MDPERKSRLGNKWACYSCGAKFYDLNKPEPFCPKCGADQRESPVFDAKPKRLRKKPARKSKLPASLPGGLDDDEIPAQPEAAEPDSIDLDDRGDVETILESAEDSELDA